jgi:hypothetical protein
MNRLFVILFFFYSSTLFAQESRIWSSYLGGTLDENYNSVTKTAVDASNNIYIVGTTGSASGIATTGSHQTTFAGNTDAFITKYDGNGAVLWSTYFGGAGYDYGFGIAIDNSGNVVIVGLTHSATGIASSGFQNTLSGTNDAFVAKFNGNGTLIWSSYYGGPSTDQANAVQVNSTGDIYFCGTTQSNANIAIGADDISFNGGIQDAFLVKFGANGARLWGTYFGSSQNDFANNVEVDANDNAYICGGSNSSTSGGTYNAFINKYTSSGSLTWSQNAGGTNQEYGFGIAVDNALNVYLSGTTSSTSGIASSGYQNTLGGGVDNFIRKYSSLGLFIWGTYYGGSGNEQNGYVALGLDNNLYLSGGSASSNAISLNGFQNTNAGGANDAYIARFTPSGAFQAASYFGGAGDDRAGQVGFSSTGEIYFSGYTTSTSGIAFNGAQSTYGGGTSDAFIAKFATCTNAPNSPTSISGNTAICGGSSNSYSVPAVSGATYYTWSLPSGWSGTSSSNSITLTAGNSSAALVVSASNACGNSASVSQAITITPTPNTPSTIVGNTTVCSGSNQTYSVTNDPLASSYTWTLPNSWSGSSTTNSITTIPAGTGGNITVTANNTCGSSSPSAISVASNTSVPAIPGTINGITEMCANTTNSYSVAAIPNTSSYTWSLPNGFSGNSTSNAISLLAGTQNGTLSVTANNVCGSSLPSNVTLTVFTSIPSQPSGISGNQSICSSSSNTYSIASVPNATSYSWTLPNGWSGTSSTTSIATVSNSNSGNVLVHANNACGSSLDAVLTISINSIPTNPGSISGNTAVCAGGNATFSVSAVSNATSYTWTLPLGWNGNSTLNSINATPGALIGTVSVVANNACGSSSASTLPITAILTIPSNPGAITGSAQVCVGDNLNYSVSPIGDASTYTWTLPATWTGDSYSSSIPVTIGSTGGTVSVVANNICGSSAAATINVNVNSIPPSPLAINGETTLCQGASTTYSIASVNGATSYTWTLPNGWAGNSSSTSITTLPNLTSGDIYVTANNTCGSSPSASLNVLVNATPTVTLNLAVDTICTYSGILDLVGGLPNGGNYSGNFVTNNLFNPSSSGVGNFTITYTYTDANSCTGTATDNVVVDACAGIQEIESNIDAQLYPSPTQGNFTLVCADLEHSKGTIRISSMSGSILYKVETNQLMNHFDISSLEAGIYFVDLVLDGNKKTLTVVKE